MAISLVATASTDAASGNISFTHGLTIASGDVIIATINVNGVGNTATDNNGSTPFTSADSVANPDSATAYVFYRVCGGSEPSSYAFTLGSSNRSCIVLRQYRGVDATVWDVAPAAASRDTGSGDTTAEAPAITIATSGACGLVLMCDDFTPTTTTFSSVNNSYANAKSETGQQYIATADKLGLSTGTTGITTITSSANVSWVAWQVALKPASSTDVNKSESVTVSEAKTVTVVSLVNKSESITVSEAKTVTLVSLVNKSESITVSEAKTVAIQTAISKTETVTLSEAVSAVVSAPQISKSETVTVSEAKTVAIQTAINATENIAVSEAVSVSVVSGAFGASGSETITLSEAASAVVSAPQISDSETVTVSEANTVAIQTAISKTETVTISEAASAVVSAPQISKSETVTVSEANTVAIQTAISQAETITLGESVSAVVSALQISASESVTLSEAISVSVGAAGGISISKTESITLSEAVNVTIAALPVLQINQAETVTVTEFYAVDYSLDVSVSDAISVTDAGLADLFTAYHVHAVELITVQDEAGAQVSERKSRFFRRYVQSHGRGDRQRA